MPRPKTKTKGEDLARIRNNQRRSRAKRLEYIRGLEEKAKKYDELIASTHSPSLSEFDKLQSENAWMRGLLATLDINFNSRKAHPGNIHDSEPNMASAVTGSLASSAETHRSMESLSPLSFWEQWDLSGLSPDMGLDFNIPLLSDEADNLALLNPPSVEPPKLAEKTFEATQQQGTQESIEESTPISLDTTLCSLACQWVIQCNTKGVELDVLYFRMERGFRQGNSPLEGCRVDNQVLLKVLTEIS
ncbi:uncharacterized protein N7500_008318 [Penicillium coprophilum]|uniref:uncharacterized protein n=1 Tax=Penicillium coprophilum TaxID=36646 RepID=UPI00238669BF|nr:uncharacterized protein N7500_008318 [Penicillium coprophilum]KAJ5158667.1 hypothetical protein N7500_008318 [Penicillium coprophilum]